MANTEQILSEGILPEVWPIVVRFLDSAVGSTTVVLAAMLARTYVGPAPLILISGLIESGLSGTYLDFILKKQLRKNGIKEELLPIADLIVKELSYDHLVRQQIAKMKKFGAKLKTLPLKSKESVIRTSKNLKMELGVAEDIVMKAIDKAMEKAHVKDAINTVQHSPEEIKKAILHALSVSKQEIQSLVR